ERVEEGGLADVGQTDDPDAQGHGCRVSSLKPARRSESGRNRAALPVWTRDGALIRHDTARARSVPGWNRRGFALSDTGPAPPAAGGRPRHEVHPARGLRKTRPSAAPSPRSPATPPLPGAAAPIRQAAVPCAGWGASGAPAPDGRRSARTGG